MHVGHFDDTFDIILVHLHVHLNLEYESFAPESEYI